MIDQKTITKIIDSFVTDKVEDANQKITDYKLALGGAICIVFIIGAFLTLSGFFTLTQENFGIIMLSNATIMIFVGAFFGWLTLTKIGIKENKSNQK